MACLRRFPSVTHIQPLIHPEQRRLIIRPCGPDAPDSLRWANGGGKRERRNRDMRCHVFAAKLFDLMQWDRRHRYKMLGKPTVYGSEALLLFKFIRFRSVCHCRLEKRLSYLPEDWRDYFGTPAERHEEAYKIDLAGGYVTTDNA